MNKTLQEALAKGVELHKAGQLDLAKKLYSSVLLLEPRHADANHNIGVIELGTGNLKQTLPHLRIALEEDPENAQYWISYIDALIQNKSIDEARNLLALAIEKGAEGEAFDQLKKKLKETFSSSDISKCLYNFYEVKQNSILSDAALGWLFYNNFESFFFANSSSDIQNNPKKLCSHNSIELVPNVNDPLVGAVNRIKEENPSIMNEYLKKNATQKINDLNDLPHIEEKLTAIKKMLKDRDPIIVYDDFRSEHIQGIFTKKEPRLGTGTLNIAILGSGVTGLFLSCILKNRFKQKVHIVVIDNRSDEIGVRQPFNRGWITCIEKDIVSKHVPSNIKNLIECFGTNGQIGLPINILETILMISCREQGVKFYFSRNADYLALPHNNIDLFFDGTGGKMTQNVGLNAENSASLIKLQQTVMNFDYAGISQIPNYSGIQSNHLEVCLRCINGLHYPYIGNMKIENHMMKITQIPVHLINTLLDYIRDKNFDNMFYVWKGHLKNEINEGLLFINLKSEDHILLSQLIKKNYFLPDFLSTNASKLLKIDIRVLKIFTFLTETEGSFKIKIEPPFNYSPHIRLSKNISRLNDKMIFPIGDSLFIGNPKVGNGLLNHLKFLNELLEELSAQPKLTNLSH